MKKISSKYTFLYKQILPVFWFISLACVIILSLTQTAAGISVVFLTIALAIAVFFYFLMRKLVRDLMDAVIDHGDRLTVQYRREEETILSTNITNVSVSKTLNYTKMTLRLRSPCKFGYEVSFIPVNNLSFNLSKKCNGEDL